MKDSARFGPEYVTDISRVLSLLTDLDNIPGEANASIQRLVRRLRSEITRKTLAGTSDNISFPISVYFCGLANGLTDQARDQLQTLKHGIKIEYAEVRLGIEIDTVLIDDLIAEKWRETNASWRTADGKKDDRVRLRVCGDLLSTPKSLTFFTNAIDLVNAFEKYGYQVFEPNVRCELKRSKVNQAIRDSIKTSRGRREFQHLNNGITIICAGFRKIRKGEELELTQPGVINGLQTVKSIHDAYDELPHSEKQDFAENCHVLVRLHTREAVSDYRALVKSTNNQNPMQPRNLRSNDPEQLLYEQMFANLGWFYERKEGAWAAFKSDHRLWGTLRGKKVADFKTARPNIVKNIDNLELAQSWLAFLGFSNEAIHDKKDIFIDDRYYDLVFLKRPLRHGADYGYRLLDPKVSEEASPNSSSPELMLVAFLARELARQITPSRKVVREQAVERLNLGRKSREDQDAALFDDTEFIRGLVLVGAYYLFPEFLGLILFKALGERAHDAGSALLRSEGFRDVFEDRDFTAWVKTPRPNPIQSTSAVRGEAEANTEGADTRVPTFGCGSYPLTLRSTSRLLILFLCPSSSLKRCP